MTAFVASLRVYEPLAAFEGAERRHWEQYAASGAVLPAKERAVALAAMVRRELPDPGLQAHVLEVDGVTLISPWRTTVRAAEALLDFTAELPDLVADAFVPMQVVERAEVELDRWRAEQGVPPAVHVRTCTWQVPLRWFLLVDAQERDVDLGVEVAVDLAVPSAVSGATTTGRRLVYRTPMSRARRRLAKALAVLRSTLDDPHVIAGVVDLGRWLEEFHPRSLVELDYGDLVHLLDDAELSQDESARDVAHALDLLEKGESDEAAAVYGRVVARMKALQAVESAN